ncbi:MAG: SdpI family protein [Halobacterium sp.]
MSSDRRLLLGGGIVVALTALVSVLAYPSMPAEMATHWNASGEVDGTMPRAFALALLPAIAAATLAFFAVIPRVDPRDGYEEFRSSYDLLAVATVAFVGYAHVLVVLANASYEFELLAALSPGIGAIYVLGGYVTDRTEQNWFVGARTPWTLEDEAVWTDTNHLVARVLQVGGVVAALGALAPDYALALAVAPALAAAVVSVAYSYREYRQD